MQTAKVVIVGSGIAGLAAAQTLRKNGFGDVVVLEGNDRIGGRIHTEVYGDGIIEIGAQWIHGEVSNPVYELACKHSLVHQVKGFCNVEDGSHLFFLSDGSFISPTIIRETSMVLDNLFNEANKFAREHISPDSDEQTVGAFIQNSFYKYLRTSSDTEETKKMRDGLFNWRLTMEKTENACASVYDMSLGAWGEYILCEGEEAVELARGYQPILDVLLDDIPRTSIKLNTHVEKIVWNETEGMQKPGETATHRVEVFTSDGEIFQADHVIVTCSLGYLKLHMDDLFLPRLPPNKASAIKRLGYGTVDKIYLEFETPFWESNCHGIQLAWLPDEKIELDCLKYLTDEKIFQFTLGHWYKGIHGFDAIMQQPNLLCGWIAGSEAQIMESLPEDLLCDICHELLQKFTGDSNIPKPIKITRTKWFSNYYSVGSYSYRHTGSTANDSDDLARPLPSEKDPCLQFAGEATHATYFSTTHGALLSGKREAERLTDLYQKVLSNN